MNLEFDQVKIELTSDECFTLYGTLRSGLIYTIETHWFNYPDSFEQQEQMRLQMMKTISRATGANYEWDFAELKKTLAACVAKKVSKVS